MSQGNYDNSNRFVLFKNKNKTQENHPDYTGSLNVSEDEFYLDAWIRKSNAGETFMSGKVKLKGAPKVAPKSAPAQDDFDSGSIPF